MNRLMRVLAVLGITGFACALVLVGLWFAQRPRTDPLAIQEGLPALRFPSFSMTDQTGAEFTRRNLEGRISIVGFMFSHCPMMCPSMMRQMGRLYAALDGESVRFVTISLDPAHDTVERLKTWGAEYRADGTRWKLLTGPEGLSRSILKDHLKMHVADDPATPVGLDDGSTMPNIQHPPHLFLVGPEGQILGFYNSQDPASMKALEDRARAAAAAVTGG